MAKNPSEHTRRDAETAIALGVFLLVMSVPVYLGTFWAGPVFDKVVNFIGASVLFLVGVGFLWQGWRWYKR
jgi:putative Mn2+ efflux pump MntP